MNRQIDWINLVIDRQVDRQANRQRYMQIERERQKDRQISEQIKEIIFLKLGEEKYQRKHLGGWCSHFRRMQSTYYSNVSAPFCTRKDCTLQVSTSTIHRHFYRDYSFTYLIAVHTLLQSFTNKFKVSVSSLLYVPLLFVFHGHAQFLSLSEHTHQSQPTRSGRNVYHAY